MPFSTRKTPWKILFALAALPAVAQVAKSPSPAQIDQAIHDLADERFAVRQNASAVLFRAGPSIEAKLTDLADASPDPEVRARAGKVLEAFSLGLMPETPPAVVELLHHYVQADASDRQIVLNQLSRQGGFGYLIVLRLSQEERDDLAAKAKAINLARDASPELMRTASELLANGQAAVGERLLTLAAKAGDTASARALGAWLDDPKKIETLLGDWSKDPPVDPEVAKQRALAIAMLWRAAGRLDRAVDAIETIDPESAVTLTIESGDAARVARLCDALPLSDRRSALLATAAHFVGDDAASNKPVEIRIPHPEDAADFTRFQTLALCDHLDEAVDVLLQRPENFVRGFDLLLAADHFTAAEHLLDKPPAAPTDLLLRRAMRARLDALVGRPPTDLPKLAKAIEADPSVDALLQLCQCETVLRRVDAQWERPLREHALAAIMLAGFPPSRASAFHLALPYADSAQAARWWDWLRQLHPDQTPADRLNLVGALLYREIKPDDLAKLATDLLAAHPYEPSDPQNREGILQALADAYDGIGQAAQSADCIDKEIALQEMALNHLAAARIAAEHKLWSRVKANLQRSEAPPSESWLRGFAIGAAGDPAAGDRLMADATRRAITDNDCEAIASVMALVGQHDESIHIRRRAMRVVAPGSGTEFIACERRLSEATQRGDWADAARIARVYLLLAQRQGVTFTSDRAFSTLPHLYHYAEAQAAVAQGDEAAASKHLRAMVAIIPLETHNAITLITTAKTVHPPLARTLFDTAAASFEAVLKAYPDHPTAHNDFAWLCVRCGYDLDRALTHANRAVALEPRNAAYLDTLAEIYVCQGKKEKGLELLDRCEALEPHDPRRAERRKEFEAR